MALKSLFVALFIAAAPACLFSAPTILPLPKSLVLGNGSLSLARDSRVVALDHELAPLAEVLAADIRRSHGVRLLVGQDMAAARIVLQLATDDPKLRGPDAYRVRVDERVTVTGGTYQAVAFGMMTVLQALEQGGSGLKIARMTVEDDADRAFRACRFLSGEATIRRNGSRK